MASDAIGTARIDIVVDTDALNAEIARAKNIVAGLGPEAEKSFAKMSAAEKKATTDALKFSQQVGMTREEIRLLTLSARGAAPEAIEKMRQSILAARTAAAQGAVTFNQYGLSAKQTTAALRQVPAQITDIVTSLQGGQNPLTVFIQQGGQLRDVFGGVTPAAKALGSALLGLVNPYTVGAAAIAGIAYTMYQAEEQMDAFNTAIVRSGNYANTTAKELQALATSIAESSNVGSGDTAEALTKVVQSGVIGASQLSDVTRTVSESTRVLGTSVEDAIGVYAKLADKPLQTLLDLNRAEHFLTQAQADRISSLETENQKQQAASEAIAIYNRHQQDMVDKVRQNYGSTQRFWEDVKTWIDSAADSAGNFGWKVSDSLVDVMKAFGSGSAFDLTDAAKARAAAGQYTPSGNGNGRRYVPSVDTNSVRDRQKASEEFDKLTERSLTKQAQLHREIAEIERIGVAAGKDRADIQKAIADAQARYNESLPKALRSTRAVASGQSESSLKRMRDQILGVTDLDKAIMAADASSLSWSKRLEDLQAQLDGGSAPAILAYRRDVEELDAAYRNGQITLQDYAAWQQALGDEFIRSTAKISDSTQQATDAMDELAKEAARNIHNSLADFLFDPFADGLDGMVKGFATTLQRIAAEVAANKILEQVGGWATNYAGGGSSWINAIGGALTKNAKGGVYDSPSLSAYSNSVVSRPTTFAFAKGAGLMGEAGPEAIMPLTRTASGKLGVQAVGDGGLNVEINNYGDSKVSARQETGQRPDGSQFKKLIVTVMREELDGGGSLKIIKQRLSVGDRV